jgi:hypothetical protein
MPVCQHCYFASIYRNYHRSYAPVMTLCCMVRVKEASSQRFPSHSNERKRDHFSLPLILPFSFLIFRPAGFIWLVLMRNCLGVGGKGGYCNQQQFSRLHSFIPPHSDPLQLLISPDLRSNKLYKTRGRARLPRKFASSLMMSRITPHRWESYIMP